MELVQMVVQTRVKKEQGSGWRCPAANGVPEYSSLRILA